jgi:TPR repeat protein
MGDEISVVEKTQEEAAQGIKESQFLLGQMYERGEVDGTDNYKEAEAWYKKAAEQGSADASYALFNLYNSKENDITADDAEKVSLLKAACEQEFEDQSYAEFTLGSYYLYGECGLDVDYAEAWKLIKSAADHGNDGAAKFCYDNSVYTESSSEDLPIWKRQSFGTGYLVKKEISPERDHIGNTFYSCEYVCPDCGKQMFKSKVRGEDKGVALILAEDGAHGFGRVFYCQDCAKVYATCGLGHLKDGECYMLEGEPQAKAFTDNMDATFARPAKY